MQQGKKEQENVICRRLIGEECRAFRPLWEEAFSAEESPAFTEYYFRSRARKNRGYGLYLEDRLVSMLYLTPYPVNLGNRAEGCPHILYYIVGVATGKDCRHRGYMTRLLREALTDMRREGLPFTYLTPADPAIYEPFGFRFLDRKPVWEFAAAAQTAELHSVGKLPAETLHAAPLPGTACPETLHAASLPGTTCPETLRSQHPQSCLGRAVWRRLRPDELGGLAELANGWLAKNRQVYVSRSASYYLDRAAELETEGGGIFGWFPVSWDRPSGVALLAGNWQRAPEEGIAEALAWEKEEDFPFRVQNTRPSVMGRVLQAEALLSLARAGKQGDFCGRLWLEDEFLPANTGAYEWKVREKTASAVRLPEARRKDCEWRLTAGEAIQLLFGQLGESETVREKNFPSGIISLSGVFLNEII